MIKLHNCDNAELMKSIKDETIDVICIDPPYLYLKNQKLELEFDEQLFFSECKRILTKNGFIVMFGRGTSFYRWNTILDDLGFTFKEEIVWNKRRITSPALPLGRVHECISIFSKFNGKINRCIINYEESKFFEIDKIVADIKRVESTLRNPDKLKHITDSLLRKSKVEDIYKAGKKQLHAATYNGNNLQKDVGIATLNSMLNGCLEKSIIDDFGVKYQSIHPTQKPVRLLERLLALVIPKDKELKDIVIADFFGGSFSAMEAVHNMGMQGIACEIDKEYFDLGKERIEKLSKQTKLF